MVSKKLKDLKNKLTDVSKRNRSITLRRCFKRSHYDLFGLSKVESGLAEKALKSLLRQKSASVLDLQSSKNEEMAQLHMLKTLRRETDFIEKETGNYDISLGWPFIEGTFMDDNHTYFRCPLLLLPVRLELDFEKEHFRLAYDERRQPAINKAFLLAFQKYNETPINPELLEDLDELPWFKTEQGFVEIAEQVAKMYVSNGIQIDNRTVSSVDKLKEFEAAAPSNDEKQTITSYRILSYAVLGQFPQATSSLLADYDNLIKRPPVGGKLVDLLSGEKDSTKNNQEIEGEELSETDNYFICPTDLSQEQILIESRKDRDLVVWGPPGTGKSQVIANLVADRTARGQRVLVVCEKRAALDVVYRRLQKEGLESMLALVHNVDDRNLVYEKIRQITENINTKPRHTNLTEISEEIDELQNSLEEYGQELHKKRACGVSLFDLYTKDKNPVNKTMEVSKFADRLTNKDLSRLLTSAKRVIPLKQKFDGSNTIISRRKNLANKTMKEIERFIHSLTELNQLSKKIDELPKLKITKAFEEEMSHKEKRLGHLSKKIGFLTQFSKKNVNRWRWIDPMWYLNGGEYADSLAVILDYHGENTPTARQTFEEALRNNTVDKLNLKTGKSWKELVDSLAVFDQATEMLETFKEFIDDTLVEEWKAKLLNLDMSPLSDWKSIPTSMKIYDEIQILDSILDKSSEIERELLSLAFKFDEKQKTEECLRILESSFIRAWVDIGEREAPIVRTLTREAYDEKRSKLDKLMKEKMKRVPELIRERWAETAISPMLFCWSDALRGKADDLIGWLKDEQPDWLEWEKVRVIETGHDEVVIGDKNKQVTFELYTETDDENENMRDGSVHFTLSVPVNREGSVHYRNYERSMPCRIGKRGKKTYLFLNAQSFSESLIHEIMKKRRRLTLRTFVDKFKNRGLFEIFPCWLCSPETVSAVMPLQPEFFDLVIFDEASQCPLEKAVPSIHRSKSVIVAGDDKQLPPFDLFRIYYSDEEEESEEADFVQSESLLHAATSLFPMKPLLWHYRSKYDALIRFSNAAFYSNNLRIISYNEPNVKPIEWIKTKGLWEGRANKVEAKKIVSIIKEIIAKPDHPSIGVVTFNLEQKNLIEQLLEEEAQSDSSFASKYAAEINRKEGEELQNLFVKNIENVQGDERDVIIFSVAYAPDSKGRLVMQFGTLSRSGGENRLNVAISRAKEKVIVVSSIEPEQLEVEGTRNEGPKMLRKYLSYAKAVAENDKKTIESLIDSFGKPTLQSPGEIYDSDFEVEVADSLRKMGYKVDTQVGCSKYLIDLAIADTKKGNYALGIECDGIAYHSSPSARERDVYRQRFLENRGWRIFRISSRDWWMDRDEVLRKIKLRLKSVSKSEMN